MTPASSAVRRLSLLGCVAVGTAALALSGCGGGASARDTAAAHPNQPAPEVHAAAARCQRQVGGFLDSMAALRANLAVGLSYEQYTAEVHGVRVAYGKIPVARLTIDCLAAAGTPGEEALNQYIDVANTWGECLAETGCDTTSIEAKLQQRWRVASHFLSEARDASGS